METERKQKIAFLMIAVTFMSVAVITGGLRSGASVRQIVATIAGIFGAVIARVWINKRMRTKTPTTASSSWILDKLRDYVFMLLGFSVGAGLTLVIL